MSRSVRGRRRRDHGDLFVRADATLLELVDNVLNRGVVITGDIVFALADVDLVYLRLSALVCAADRVLGQGEPPP
jgi:hypothetical protein